jgi:hypothetical protein
MVYDITASQSFADLEGWYSEFRAMGSSSSDHGLLLVFAC